jgi:murein DD-endopeptidase MepM/ murein hydrolase activator NlpD
MKNTLNKILYKLAEAELNNSDTIINEQAWQKIKNLFKKDNIDEPDIATSKTTSDSDEITIQYYKLNPPIANASVTSPYGWRKFRQHEGVDFAVPVGTTVHALRPGVVVKTGDQKSGWGNYVVTKHEPVNIDGNVIGETFFALYAHLSEISVVTGEEVDFDTIIGKTGGAEGAPGSGNSNGPHLHFEIQLSLLNNQIDPVRFYKKYKQRLENASIQTDTDQSVNKPNDYTTDYIVKPTVNKVQSTVKPSDVNSIVTAQTIQDGFTLYILPKDTEWIYGIPVDNTRKYGWWAHKISDNTWLNLQAHLRPTAYKTAVSLLNSQFPNALNKDLVVPGVDMEDKQQQKPKPITTDTKNIFSKLGKYKQYTPASILKSNKIDLYTFDSNTKKFKKEFTVEIENSDSIKYLGHDTLNQYMHVRILSKTDDPNSNKKYWINVKDINLSKRKNF